MPITHDALPQLANSLYVLLKYTNVIKTDICLDILGFAIIYK